MKLDSRMLIAAAAAAGIVLAAMSGVTGATDAASGPGATPPADPGAALPPDHPPIPSAGSGSAAGPAPSGTVEETLQAAGYTYARLSTADAEIWAAGPVTELEEGQTVSLAGAMNMGRFESAALERTFDPLYFTERFVTGDAAGGAGAVGAGGAGVVGGNGGAGGAGGFRGSVKQVIPVSRYVYLEVETEEGPAWLAAPETEVAEGDVVAWPGGTMMTDFTSSTLDRTFDEILFVGGLEVVGGG